MRREGRRLWRRGTARALVALVLVLGAPVAAAEPLYITDRLMLGVHEQPSRNSPVVTLLPSGTELEVIERDGALARVRGPEGVEGWVDNGYLSKTKPDSARVDEYRETARLAEGRLTETTRAHAAVEARLAEMTTLRDEAEAQVAAREAELAGALAEASDAKAELAARADETPAETEALTQALRDVQRMAEENQRLKQELAELAANQAMIVEQDAASAADAGAEPAPASSSGGDYPYYAGVQAGLRGLLAWAPWEWLLLGSVVLLAFGAGGYMVDLGVRRRHGGFRI